MGILGFLLFSIALSSASIGCWRAWRAWASGNWANYGDNHLFWETWAADPGGTRLIQAAGLAILLVLAARIFSSPKIHKVISLFSGRRPVSLVVLIALFPQLIANSMRPEPSQPRNILFVTLDTVRLDHVGWAGFNEFPTTPQLDELAKVGAAFTGAIAQSSWTKPATASMLTGLVPTNHEAIGRPARGAFLDLPQNIRTIQEAFASGGWTTGAISSNPNISSQFGFNQGFQSFVENTNLTAPEAIDYAKQFINQADEQPWFLYLHLNDAHYPYLPPMEWKGKFGSQLEGWNLTGPTERNFRNRQSNWDKNDVDQLRRAWAEEIAALDFYVGSWVKSLIKADPNLLVVIVADHGEEFLDHGDLGHGHSLYDELIRVPLQFAWGSNWNLQPGLIHQQLSAMDIAPTLLDLCELTWPEAAMPMDGVSFSATLETGEFLKERQAFSATESPGSPLSGMAGPLRSWRSAEWKWIEGDPWTDAKNRGWLFNLGLDQNEQTNLANQDPLLVQLLRNQLRSSGFLEAISYPIQMQALDQESILELEALGYLEESTSDENYFAPFAPRWHICEGF